MTTYKVYRLEMSGSVSVVLVEAMDWGNLIVAQQYIGGVIFRMEAVGSTDIPTDYTSGEQ